MKPLEIDPSVDGQSLSSLIYEQIRARIIRGDFAPGSRLRERELAEELAVSRIPLREALPQLEADGFIRTEPRRGAVVTQLTMRDIADLFDVRMNVETYAAGQAAERVGRGASCLPIRAAILETDEALRSRDSDRIVLAKARFHEAVVEVAGNALLETMMRAVAGRIHWVLQLTAESDSDSACDEHNELYEAIQSGNIKLAEALAHVHIERGRRLTLEALADVLPRGTDDFDLPR